MCRYSIETLGRKEFFSISTSSFLLHLHLNPPLSLYPSLHFSLPFNFSLSAILSLTLSRTLPFSSLSLVLSLSLLLFICQCHSFLHLSPHLTSQDVNERAKAESLLSSTAAAQAAGQIRRLSGMKRKPTIKFCQLFTSHIPFCLLGDFSRFSHNYYIR